MTRDAIKRAIIEWLGPAYREGMSTNPDYFDEQAVDELVDKLTDEEPPPQ